MRALFHNCSLQHIWTQLLQKSLKLRKARGKVLPMIASRKKHYARTLQMCSDATPRYFKTRACNTATAWFLRLSKYLSRLRSKTARKPVDLRIGTHQAKKGAIQRLISLTRFWWSRSKKVRTMRERACNKHHVTIKVLKNSLHSWCPSRCLSLSYSKNRRLQLWWLQEISHSHIAT